MPLFPLSVGGVTSVALSAPSSILTVSGSPGTGAVSLGLTLATQNANKVWAGPTTGADAAPTFRALVTADLPVGTGTVTSVALTVPSILSVSGSPITTSGTLAVTLTNQSANLVFAGPTTGAATTPTFRSLVAADIPDLSSVYQPLNTKLTNFAALANASGVLTNNGSGTYSWAAASTGTVTSVAMTVPTILSVSGSPITTSGTLAVTLATQSANLVFAGPTTGSAATPTFRALVAADIPSLSATYALTGAVTGSGLTMSTARLLGRTTASTGAIEEISVGTSLSLSAGSLNAIQDIRTSASPSFSGLTSSGGVTVGTGSTVSGSSAQFPAGLTINESTHATSRRAFLGVGQWAIIQDINGTGSRSLVIYDGLASATRLTIDTSGNIVFANPIRLSSAYTASSITATGYVTLQASDGLTYKVLVST